MNILFIQNNGINESFVITDIAAYLKSRGHAVDLLIAREERHLFKKISAFDPQLIVFPCPILDKNWYLELAGDIKKYFSCRIIFWGAAATFYPQSVLGNKHCDFICRGEGEYAIAELALRLEEGKPYGDVRNIGFMKDDKAVINPLRPLVDDLDALPLPDRSIYYKYRFLGRINSKRFITSRGCKKLCNACWNNAISNVYGNPDNFYRRKSPERVIAEISGVAAEYGLTSLHFSDDLFIHPDYDKWLSAFLGLYAGKIKIPFTCNARADYLNGDIARMLRRAGCRALAMSVESGNCRIRNDVLKKDITKEHIIQAAKCLSSAKIKLLTFNVMAVPDETIEDVYSTIELNQRIRADYSRVNMIFPLSTSTLYLKAREKGLVSTDCFDEIINLEKQLFTPIFYRGKRRDFVNAYLLFCFAIRCRIPIPMLKILVALPLAFFYQAIWMIVSQFNEKQFFGVNFLTGLPYFWHTKGVTRRSENLTSIY